MVLIVQKILRGRANHDSNDVDIGRTDLPAFAVPGVPRPGNLHANEFNEEPGTELLFNWSRNRTLRGQDGVGTGLSRGQTLAGTDEVTTTERPQCGGANGSYLVRPRNLVPSAESTT